MHMTAWREKAQSGQRLTNRASQEPRKSKQEDSFPKRSSWWSPPHKITAWEPEDRQLPVGESTGE